MARTVLSIEPDGRDGFQVRLERAPLKFPGARVPGPLDCSPDTFPDWTTPNGVAAYGQCLADRLSGHDAVRQALQALALAPPGQRAPLYVRVLAPEADALRWEALRSGQGDFFALRSSSPVGRIVYVDSGEDRRPDPFEPPLRVMALLSALGVPAGKEWASLRRAVQDAHQAGLPVEVEVRVGEPGLLLEINAAAVPGVRAALLPSRSNELEQDIEAFRPHLLHAFCHGSVGYGAGWLELATSVDWELTDGGMPPERGSLVVDVDQLTRLAAVRTAWLVTLNCCEGGRSTAELHAMAARLVEAGTAAAIGMQEPVHAGDAHEFCRAFYPALFDLLADRLAPGAAGATEIEWADALYAPRRALLDRNGHDPTSDRTWTLPVLYVRPERFHVLRQAAPQPGAPEPSPEEIDAMRERAHIVAGLLRVLPEGTPEAARDDLLALLADLPPTLRPRRDGSFESGPPP